MQGQAFQFSIESYKSSRGRFSRENFLNFSQAMGSSCCVGVQQIFSPEMPNAAFQHELILIRKESGFAKHSCGFLFFFSEELATSLLSAGAKGEQEGGVRSQMLPFMCLRKRKNKSAFLALGERHKQHVKLV